ncbi:hypothetical protein ACMD2_12676 [Ananas comosus]|uniref:Uncharacterized protein n=1 Tax=Ananas comosus TaxID=4615 RepID=A0A199W919_ANACO|nr:hypothetical protein ACMD2_12676 [Ananas comosus]
MLKLSELLSIAGGLHVAFVSSDYNNRSRLANGPRLSGHSRLRFRYIPDGFEDDRPRSTLRFMQLEELLLIELQRKDIFGRVAAGDGTGGRG